MILRLLDRLDLSTCNFLAVKTIRDSLESAGFKELRAEDNWKPKPGGKYYIVKNSSAIFAFIPGTKPMSEAGCRIIASHSDSPCFKIKPNSEIEGDGGVISLNVEKYGGAIFYTWFDRPLSISGRVFIDSGDPFHPEERLVDLVRPVATIPHLAIHFNRAVNEGNPLSVQKDMKPVIGFFSEEERKEMKRRGGAVKVMVAETLGIEPEKILDYELCLYPCGKGTLTGLKRDYFQSPRIDDLSMAFASMEAFIEECGHDTEYTRILAVFDNEETGSGTKQGAHSPVLRNIMERLCIGLGGKGEDFYRCVARSFMISADNAHGWHPNYDSKYDPTNHPVLGGGPVVKINANCKYMTDADGAAVFRTLCAKAGVPCQYFVNHSDVQGGSTLGNIFTGQMDVRGVDMGNAVWAMHSACETASVADHEMVVRVFRLFYK